MERSILNITYKDRKTNIWVRERTKVIYVISNVREKHEEVLDRAHQPPQRHPDRPWVSPLGDHTTRTDDTEEPIGGETTWTHTGATRYGRGQQHIC